MDNITHSLVGLAAAKAGLERTSPYSTAVCIIAANLPDGDWVMLFAGSWEYLKHHRGISHSIVGTLTLAALLPLSFCAMDYLIARLRRRLPRARFGPLLLSSLILSASHPVMDWTNNYGVRPLLPWSGQWFYGDLVFIADPWLWLIIGGAAFLLTARGTWRTVVWISLATIITLGMLAVPARLQMSFPVVAFVLWIAGLVVLGIARRAQLVSRSGPAVAVIALMLVVVYWGGLAVIHSRAVGLARDVAVREAEAGREVLIGVAAMPTLANPLRWICVSETDSAYTRFELDITNPSAMVDNRVRFDKPAGDGANLVNRAASEDQRVRIFLEFARFPAVRTASNCVEECLVQLADLRFTEPGIKRGSFALDVPVKVTPAASK